MKNMVRGIVLSLLLIAACMVYGDVPSMGVTVSDAAGNAAFKGRTNANGTFATRNLRTGHYVVQFNATSVAVKGNYYALVVSSGNKKVSASAVPGEKLTGGGVAMRVDVGAGLNITGQVAPDLNAKIMVWIPPVLGSNMPGHWAEKGSAEEISSRTRGTVPRSKIQKIQDSQAGFAG